MFAYQDIVAGVKAAAKTNRSEDYSHCQLLNLYSRNLGFQSFHHLQTSLKTIPNDNFGQISTKLMRKVCASKLPSQDSSYFEFWCHADGSISFYSYWIGWDRFGKEVRVPRPLIGLSSVKGLREQNDAPVYVLESSKEVLAWKYGWKGTAYMPESIAREYFAFSFNKDHLVDKNPNMALVRKNSPFGAGNFCRD
ncbi:hypothetical protein WD347_004562 [Vibrio parahaemolyticus]|uniref:hypothetical protein n=1 Tax=Vibrio parahaemolyticus TaxID=670 RepID=UPI00038E67CA|nr:hypothetical protein [Vibrio parahaemolyticus]EJG0923666.1 hypothetical protein [Vibrio parahaemolyticus O1:K68]EJG0933332.1 hypothetical protein [Vibrio parahaemolyticus O1]EJG0947624.1 hypothetical protein [Vibrio parahaemolyticus O10]EQM49571.1 hypothetical protein D051_4019 [Vibrio parahaemolyticus VPCR-2010]EGQ9065139.1 hypothetical protein [Vibrio parahaemolyticus]